MSAVISDCGRFRYRLDRLIGDGPSVAVIMVNPSTADAETDDATIRKLKGFATRHGWGRIVVGNLFAFRSTDIKGLAIVEDPRGAKNNEHLREVISECDFLLFAWGPAAKVPKQWRSRWRAVDQMAAGLGKHPMCLGTAQCGHPRHPLMTAYDTPLTIWKAPQ